jgi:hypothetical protein
LVAPPQRQASYENHHRDALYDNGKTSGREADYERGDTQHAENTGGQYEEEQYEGEQYEEDELNGPMAQEEAGDDAHLPPGWLEFETDDGNVYYYNALTEETVWELPTE